MEDRLIQLQEFSGIKDRIQLDNSFSSQDENFMPQFSSNVQKVQQSLNIIKNNNLRMREMLSKYSIATTSSVEQGLSRELEQIMMQNQQISKQIKEAMKDIKEEVERSKREKDQEDQTETRIQIEQENALASSVYEVLQASSQISYQYQIGVREKIKRQARILDENATEQFLNEICNDPQKATQLLQNKLYGGAPSVQLTSAVSDIQEKYKDIQQLEKSVQLVFQLQQDLAILVGTQGQITTNIEGSLTSAKSYVNKAKDDLIDAEGDHKSAKKKICCIILIGVVILAVIIGPIVATA
ncbi:unnamed protein product (macronuclear) [Paramecium tetraurelia]|uniref:Chromosome undetermined scaffold_22, whole genome shotgun sequence n=1 Tax=Paramecium tetraurelia TaxID=5888 RepID=Q3M0Y4_PARTE|nr:uncharacterized protein GSPATT00008763001 [Paramecium tetraurelia]CAH69639.1 syntaxin 1-2 [Paramecium tetraurelia]CAK72321.1 unnamed protein product [Paramecium tetraurelia]|eukprot:XP_001439718.1 hypothetical protein (macronuclear) [Paramecium tetraurelia strain d4-2]